MTVWNPNGITFADKNGVGLHPYSIFIDKNNTIYVAVRFNDSILIWTNDSINLRTSISTKSSNQNVIFITSNDEIYIGTQEPSQQINKWKLKTNETEVVANLDKNYYGLFVDINNTLYFSVRDQHKVMAKSLSNISNILTIVVDTDSNGNAALSKPHGLFVDTNFNLYVADTGNNRIQLFRSKTSNATTVAGTGSIYITITLNFPTSVVLDGDKYLFIVDHQNDRIVGSGPYGFRCIIGCTGSRDSKSNTLDRPTTMAFDSYGNIYVADEYNNRIQKFLRLNNSLSKCF